MARLWAPLQSNAAEQHCRKHCRAHHRVFEKSFDEMRAPMRTKSHRGRHAVDYCESGTEFRMGRTSSSHAHFLDIVPRLGGEGRVVHQGACIGGGKWLQVERRRRAASNHSVHAELQRANRRVRDSPVGRRRPGLTQLAAQPRTTASTALQPQRTPA